MIYKYDRYVIPCTVATQLKDIYREAENFSAAPKAHFKWLHII